MVVVLVVCIIAALLIGLVGGARLAANAGRKARARRGPDDAAARTRGELASTRERLAEVEASLARAQAALATAQPSPPPSPAAVTDPAGAPGAAHAADAADVPRATAEVAHAAGEVAHAGGEAAHAGGEAKVAVAEDDEIVLPDVADGGRDSGRASAGDNRDGRILDAVWQLQRLDLEIGRRRDAELSTFDDPDSGPVGLAQAVQQEIDRTREEIGTPGAFHSDLGAEPGPAVSVLVLRAVQSTLAFVARRSQAFDLHLAHDERVVEVTVLCDEFETDESGPSGLGMVGTRDLGSGRAPSDEDPGTAIGTGTGGGGMVTTLTEAGTDEILVGTEAGADAAAISAAIAAAGGTLHLDRDADGRIRAHLRVPVA